MRQAAGDLINPDCVSIGFFAEPATPIELELFRLRDCHITGREYTVAIM
jgi:hypothetical protein